MRNKDIASDKLIYFLLVLKVIVKVNFEKLFCSLNVEPVEFQAILALIELIATHDYPRSEAEEKQSEFFNQSDYKIIPMRIKFYLAAHAPKRFVEVYGNCYGDKCYHCKTKDNTTN